MASLTVYSQNVSCDRHSEKLTEQEHMEEFSFRNRIEEIVKKLSKDLDVVAINEIRYKDNLDLVKDLLTQNGFEANSFRNNDGDMSFNNIVAVRKGGDWKVEAWKHRWVAYENKKAFMSDKHATVKVSEKEQDPHGRCAGVVYLKHKTKEARVCILVSHVVPFGSVKEQQQNALMSANSENMKLKRKLPTIVAGDLNRFLEESERFAKQLDDYKLIEAEPTKLVIPKYLEVNKAKYIGTFTPWPVDGIYDEKIKTPMSESRLDVQLLSKDDSLIELKSSEVRAVMFKEPNVVVSQDSKDYAEGMDVIRYILDRKMASDHLALICKYVVKEAK